MAHKFLSDEWVAAAREIYDEYQGRTQPPTHAVRMNQVITGVPFGDGIVNAHMDTSDGEMRMDLGHLDVAEVTVTLDYDTARSIFVDLDPQAGMQAFMAGKIKVQGDITRLMALQTLTPDPLAAEIATRIRDITE